MCLAWLKERFRRSPEPAVVVTLPVAVEPSLAIPHPEEPPNLAATPANTDIEVVRAKWFADWDVPANHQGFWARVDLKLVADLHILYEKVPAATWAEQLMMEIDPQWANPGILAHEMAHISYSLLEAGGKVTFEIAFKQALETDPLLKHILSVKPYMGKDVVEGHADCYRYAGMGMPAYLKPFYPKLW